MRSELECEFIGFTPDQGLKNFISTVGENLLDLAPTNSILKVFLKKNEDVIKASFRIFSYAGVFEAQAQSERELSAIRNAEEKIRRQIERWKEHRFDKPSLRLSSFGNAI